MERLHRIEDSQEPSVEEVAALQADLASTVRVLIPKGKRHSKNKLRKRKLRADRKFDRDIMESWELDAVLGTQPSLRLTEPCDGDGEVVETAPEAQGESNAHEIFAVSDVPVHDSSISSRRRRRDGSSQTSRAV